MTLEFVNTPKPRIYHAGVSDMHVKLLQSGGKVLMETRADYSADGTVAVGNAGADKYRFVTHVESGRLNMEEVVKSTGAVVMTAREVEEATARRKFTKAKLVEAAESMITLKDKDGNLLVSKKKDEEADDTTKQVLTTDKEAAQQ